MPVKMLSTTTVVVPTCLIKVCLYFQVLGSHTGSIAAFHIHLFEIEQVICMFSP